MYLSTQLLKVDPKTYKTDDPNDYTTPSYFGHEADNFVGQLCKKTSLVSLLKCAVLEAKQQYEDIEIELKVAGDPELTFTGVPYISHDIMDALLDDAIQNNLVRQEQFGTPPSKIEITVAQKKENENYIVRVSDTAGGQPLDSLDTMLTCWSVYRHFENQYETSGNCSTWSKSPIKIPYAYCAAKVFGGDVSYVSIDGYGTDRQVVFPSHGLTGCSI
ncbi:pyruvate dehydrogenase kinase [Angomonas deanei]|uniref:Protein-serine/threonine kinase n=1 Tax=Angomonas deanei TaxID=59799 RepID=A0A7G2CLP4_9TRYP|nr:pyruvate dehydrogenase kinase [Angomonas deanei]CAD2219987.1 hypothetical protein, conserved [Angomonas deanei]|eukprot:EPY22270.1 pyruvate dehydrogenase kinase [Angomonas deanei]